MYGFQPPIVYGSDGFVDDGLDDGLVDGLGFIGFIVSAVSLRR